MMTFIEFAEEVNYLGEKYLKEEFRFSACAIESLYHGRYTNVRLDIEYKCKITIKDVAKVLPNEYESNPNKLILPFTMIIIILNLTIEFMGSYS